MPHHEFIDVQDFRIDDFAIMFDWDFLPFQTRVLKDRYRPKADIRLRKIKQKVPLRFLTQMLHFWLTANSAAKKKMRPGLREF